MINNPSNAQMADALIFVPPKHRDVLVDHFLRGYTARDMAMMHARTPREIAAQTREALSAVTQVARFRTMTGNGPPVPARRPR